MREIRPDETPRLYECMEDLAEHHNEVSVYFKGGYPTISSEQIVKQFADDLETGKSFIAVIEKGETIVAFCKIDISGDSGFIDYLSVRRGERGSGYGNELMEWALQKFEEYHVRTIEGKVVYGNDVTDFYRKYGFMEKSILMCRKQ